ncbi:stage III sporulation protein AF [Bacillus lacus]|uniref:Stage III sporulation protein AF n=1 Tax=Metabacillus lacus TaxID=1983721 RepID=A0A7X2J0G4_9BACI|nr:stage III sporulation protein AF [Metabacillus lacus]MRX73172.1 stage III sporulation protein AF [Metabacillus lacus]
MAFISGWVSNIILFIFLSIIIELLLPSSAMKKYVKVVLGLLLIVMILQPVFSFFSKDIGESLGEWQEANGTGNDYIKKSIDLKKREIQASHTAYILEQMAVQLKSMAEEELVNSYGLEIADIKLETSKQLTELSSQQDIEGVYVVLQSSAEEESVEAVKLVSIDTEKKDAEKLNDSQKNNSKIVTLLGRCWQLDPGVITISHTEGGEEAR